MPNSGGSNTRNGGGSAESLAHNSAAKDDVVTTQTFTVNDLLANDPGSAHNFTFLDNHVVANGDGTYSLAEGFSSFEYKVQLANGAWSEAEVTSTGHMEQLLQNFSFENEPTVGAVTGFSQIAGWNNLGGTMLEICNTTVYNVGGDGHWLDTQASPGGITIGQTVDDLVAGQHAKLSLSVTPELNAQWNLHPNSTLTITWDGQVVLQLTEADFKDSSGNVVYNHLKTFSVDVVGHGGGDSLVIHDDGTGLVGYALDWVKLDAWVVG